jgi:AcrR family transcriptional regulator
MAAMARPYDSPRRREQAAGTRRLILDEAQRLFERDGYAGTSVAAVAKAAGVALKTVYLTFETKAGLLRAVWHRALRGDLEEVPVGEQEWYRQALDEPDPTRRLALTARNSRMVKERSAAIMEVIRAAAPGDPEIGALWERIKTDFRDNQRTIVQSLSRDRALRKGLTVETGADIMWALNQPSLYELLVNDRGWTPERYERWLRDLFCTELLRPEAQDGRSSKRGRPSSGIGSQGAA